MSTKNLSLRRPISALLSRRRAVLVDRESSKEGQHRWPLPKISSFSNQFDIELYVPQVIDMMRLR